MGNRVSKRDKKLMIGSSVVLGSFIMFRVTRYFYKKAKIQQMKNFLKNRENLQNILLNKQITKDDKIEFQKDKMYEDSIRKIQKLRSAVISKQKSNASREKILELKKSLIRAVHEQIWGLSIACNLQIFEITRQKRRLKIDSLGEYIRSVQAELRQNEVIWYLCRKEVLGDARVPDKEYKEEFQSLFDTIPTFFIELSITAEFEKVLRRPHREKRLLISDIEDYYKQSITILNEIGKREVFRDLSKKISADRLGKIVQIYIEDRIAISMDIEKEDINRKREFLKSGSIQRLKGKFNDLFLNYFP